MGENRYFGDLRDEMLPYGVIITNNEGETDAFAQEIGAGLCAGDCVLLIGDLGAGKSVVARGIARGLGVMGHVPSPTFTIMIAHEGRLPFYHFDAYRLSSREQWEELGLDEFIGGDGVCAVEWPENVGVRPKRRIEMRISREGDSRRIEWAWFLH